MGSTNQAGRVSRRFISNPSFFSLVFFKCWTAQASFPDRRNIVADRRLSQYFDYPNIFVPCLELAAGAALVTSPRLAAGTRSWEMWEWGWVCPDSMAWLIQRDTGKPFQVNSPSSSLAKLTLPGKICSSLGITADKRMFKAQSHAEHFNFPPGDPIFLCAVTPTRWTRIYRFLGETPGSFVHLLWKFWNFFLCVLTVIKQYFDNFFLLSSSF